MTPDFKQHLNPSQLEAVTTINGPVLVIAGAGSGKTRVIEYRVLYLIEQKVKPNSILLLTFTRRAAYEMLARAAAHNDQARQVEGGTFHSFAYKILRHYGKTIGLNNSFSILDEADAETALWRCASKLNLLETGQRFPKKTTLRQIVSMSINKQLSLETVVEKEYPHFSALASELENLKKKYFEYKIQSNYLDYDDLLIYLRLLLENETLRQRLAEQYQFIMVDEYQDTNKLQGDISYLLAKPHQNIMAVGDDAQSIYGFRGASHENIMEFPKKFNDCKIIKLEANYRSTQAILDVGNEILKNMETKFEKALTSAQQPQGDKPQLLFFKDSYDEAQWLADTIQQFRDEEIPLHRQAILFRSAYVSIPLQAELSARNIPFQVFGGLKFYETAHIKDLLAHLKIILNHRDDLSWSRTLHLLEGIGTKTVEKLLDELLLCASLEQVSDRIVSKYITGFRYSEQLRALDKMLRQVLKAKGNFEEIFEQVSIYYLPLLKLKYDDWHIRLNDIESLRQIASRYRSLEEFLADLSIEAPERGVAEVEAKISDNEKPLTLSTIHSAKGLEWEVVFLIGLIDGVLPTRFALSDDNELGEEQRLLYVAVTRAKKRLFLSLHHHGKKGGIVQFNKLSRFIDSPNILAVLDQKHFLPQTDEQSSEYEQDVNELGLSELGQSQDSLYKRIINFLEE